MSNDASFTEPIRFTVDLEVRVNSEWDAISAATAPARDADGAPQGVLAPSLVEAVQFLLAQRLYTPNPLEPQDGFQVLSAMVQPVDLND